MSTPSGVNSDLGSALGDARARYVRARPKSAALYEEAVRVLPGGNTRSVLAYKPFPTAMARGEGCQLWDIDGHAYLDLCGEYTAGLFGHTNSQIHDAIRAAIANGLSLAAVGAGEVELARILCVRFPSIELVRFTNSGTEANLMAITAARAFTRRERLMAFRGGYHGGVLTFPVSGPSAVTAPFPVVMADYNDAEGAIALVREHAADLAAIIIEPMLGSGGCIPASPDFLRALREAATAAGAVLIFDEVMTSRMSSGGMQARLGIQPDMTTLGKYVAGGMSFGAFGGRAAILDQFAATLPHAGTFNNNVLSMAAGRVAMGEIFTADVAEALWTRGERMRAALNATCAAAGVALQFSGLGSMATPHFRSGIVDRPYPASADEEGLRELFFFDMLEAGIYLARRGMVALSLPVTEPDLERFKGAVAEFIAVRRPLLQEVTP
jgi:glutamate-1-semialdehyde 2,1-aminomutase